MNPISYCPECGKSFSTASKYCTCGWTFPTEQKAALIDDRCEYQASGKRCALPGTICSHLYGKGPWYCLNHWQEQSVHKNNLFKKK